MNDALNFKDNVWSEFVISNIQCEQSTVALESTQNKIDKNVHGKSTKYDNAIKIAQSRYENRIPFSNMKGFFFF